MQTWHYRGGLSDNGAQIVYEPDGQGGIRAIVLGQDAYGNDQVIQADAPWWGNLLQEGIHATAGAFGSRRSRFDQQPAVAVTAAPQGITAGLSSNTLLLIGVVAAFFLLGRGRR